MSAAFRTSLEFFQMGVVATSCSLAAAMFIELLFPRYDESRNPALQALEGILGMTFHYILGLEMFMAAVPLTGRLYPSTIFAVLTPVMVPNSLAKMSGNVRGLSDAVRPALPTNGGSMNPAPPPRPAPGTPDYSKMVEEVEQRVSDAMLALKQAVAAMPDLVTAEQLATELRDLQRDMEREMALMSGDLIRTGKAWAQHERVLFEQKYNERNAEWGQYIKQLKHDFAVQWAALKAQWELRPRCPGAPGCEFPDPVLEPGEMICKETVGGLKCKEDAPTEVVPIIRPPLQPGTYAYTDDLNACEETIAGYKADGRYQMYSLMNGAVIGPMLTTNPVTGKKDNSLYCPRA